MEVSATCSTGECHLSQEGFPQRTFSFVLSVELVAVRISCGTEAFVDDDAIHNIACSMTDPYYFVHEPAPGVIENHGGAKVFPVKLVNGSIWPQLRLMRTMESATQFGIFQSGVS
jgi:hypothetical protein